MFLHQGWTVSGLISVVWKIGFGCWRRGLEVESRRAHGYAGMRGEKERGKSDIFLHFFLLHFFLLYFSLDGSMDGFFSSSRFCFLDFRKY